MKKITALLFALLMIGSTALFVACDDDEDDNSIDCTALVQEMTNAATAFATSPSTATCEDYKALLEDIVSGCEDELTQLELDTYQAVIDGMDCSLY